MQVYVVCVETIYRVHFTGFRVPWSYAVFLPRCRSKNGHKVCPRYQRGKCGGCHKNPGGKISPGYENAFESELLALRGSPARR